MAEKDKKGVKVTFLDQTGAKSVQAIISENVQVRKIIPQIITKMKLPVTSPDGTPMSYSLDHKEGGKRLLEDQTLTDANIKDGDHLIVYPEIVAGRSRPRAPGAPRTMLAVESSTGTAAGGPLRRAAR